METGKKGIKEVIVTEDMAASKAGLGLPPVLSTPTLVELMETTCYESIIDELGEGQATVGAKVDITHMAATPIGMKVRIETELVETDRSKLVFDVAAFDEHEMVGKGKHVRFIIDSKGFIDNLAKKTEMIK